MKNLSFRFRIFLMILMFSILSIFSISSYAKDPAFVRISKENPNYFELTDGSPWIAIGVNLCILREYKSDTNKDRFIDDTEEGLRKVEFYFRKLSENGGNYARIWLGSPFFEIERDHQGNYKKEILDRLNAVLILAQKYGIRLKLCLEQFRQINPNIKVQTPLFLKDIYYTTPPSSMKEFVSSDLGRKYYLDRCREFANHFKDNPWIFGWEIWNEVNCLPDHYRWTKDVIRPLHEMFPNHLIMQSLGSFDRESSTQMYKRMILMPENEVAQIHRYLDPGAQLAICKGPMDKLSVDMVDELRAYHSGKPILATEMGAVENCHSGPSKLYPLDHEGILFHDILFAPFFAGAAGSGHCWHWSYYLEKNNLWYHIGRFSRAIKNVDPIREDLQPFRIPSEIKNTSFMLYGLKGKTQTLIWIRSQADSWKTELVEKIPAKTYTNLEFSLPECNADKVLVYDPWTDQEETLPVKNGSVCIPKFKRSIVVRWNK